MSWRLFSLTHPSPGERGWGQMPARPGSMRVKPLLDRPEVHRDRGEVVHFRESGGHPETVDRLDVAVARLARLDAQGGIAVVLEGGELVRDLPRGNRRQRIRPKSHSPPQSAQPSIRRAPSIWEPSLRAEIQAASRRRDTGPAGGPGRERTLTERRSST